MKENKQHQLPEDCARLHHDGIHCEARIERAGEYHIWVNPCQLLDKSVRRCRDFKPKDPSDCENYGCDGHCYAHSRKTGNAHISMSCDADKRESCVDFTHKTEDE